MSTTIAKVQTQDKDFNQYQQNVTTALQPIFGCPINFGTQLTSIVLGSGDTTVSHGLNRVLNGWFIVRQRDAAASIYDKYDTQNTTTYPKDKFIVLNSSAQVTCDIWVF